MDVRQRIGGTDFIWSVHRIRIVSARPATGAEEDIYDQ